MMLFVLGSPFDNGISSGSVYLFNTTDGSLFHKLIADDGKYGDQFGLSIALSNDVLSIGPP